MRYAKAYVSATIAGLASTQAALTDGSILAAEWVAVAIATLTAFAAVAFTPNAADDGDDGDDLGDNPAGLLP